MREGIIAAALNSLMILFFLGSWRSTVIIATSIPLAVLSALLATGVVGVHMAGVGTARVQVPQQLQRQHPGLAGAQPHQQLRQQATRAAFANDQ